MDYQREIAIACHAQSIMPRSAEVVWRRFPKDKYRPADDPFRTCSYCGSIHPIDLLVYMEKGQADLSGSDWKYGWPHKFYCDVPNPHEGDMVQIGSQWANGEERPLIGKSSPFLHTKFYNIHLNDLEDEEFFQVSERLLVYTGILFERKQGKLWFTSPRGGYQAVGLQGALFREYLRKGEPLAAAMAHAAQELREGMRQNQEH